MSAVCLKLLVVLCLSWTMMMMMTEAGSNNVIRKKPGEDFTIQCRHPPDTETFEMELSKGLNEEVPLFHRNRKYGDTVSGERLQIHGEFPNIDFFIYDLKVEDTGIYWCVYNKQENYNLFKTKGEGSVLLVVTGTAKDAKQECEESNYGLILVAVSVSVTVILLITAFFFFWFFYQRRTVQTTVKRTTVHTSDIYEDMKATTRRENTASSNLLQMHC